MNKIVEILEKLYNDETETRETSPILLEYDTNTSARLKNINDQLSALRRRTPENMANPTMRARKFAALMKERKQLLQSKKTVAVPQKVPMLPTKQNI